MSSIQPSNSGGAGGLTPAGSAGGMTSSEGATNLADVLERVLDKGIVIVGDIRVNLLDIELLTIKLRLIVAGVDTARRIGINWWETDPWLSGREEEEDSRSLSERVKRIEGQLESSSRSGGDRSPDDEKDALREEVERLQRQLERSSSSGEAGND